MEMEFRRSWFVPCEGERMPDSGLIETVETTDGKQLINIRHLNMVLNEPKEEPAE